LGQYGLELNQDGAYRLADCGVARDQGHLYAHDPDDGQLLQWVCPGQAGQEAVQEAEEVFVEKWLSIGGDQRKAQAWVASWRTDHGWGRLG
jgi:hypothetical protein